MDGFMPNDKDDLNDSSNADLDLALTQNTVPESEITKEDLWNNIGFHRPLGGFFYNLFS